MTLLDPNAVSGPGGAGTPIYTPATPSPMGNLANPGVGPTAVPNNPGIPGGINTPGYGNITTKNGTALRTVDPNQLAGTQLANLESNTSPLNQLALAQGAAQAAATGNANGTLMAGAAQTALLQNLTPIAAQQAQQYAETAQANQDALNQLQQSRIQAGAQVRAAGEGAAASMANAKLAAATQQALQTQSLAQNQSQFEDNWANNFKMATQNEFTLKSGALGNAMNTIFSDPSYWGNPQASMGMINFFTQNIGSLIDSLGLGTGTGNGTTIPNALATA
jgi:hypothetical protein